MARTVVIRRQDFEKLISRNNWIFKNSRYTAHRNRGKQGGRWERIYFKTDK